jgi:hypothetical protein
MKVAKSWLCFLWFGMCLMFAYAQEDTELGTSQREVLFRRYEELIEEDEANQEVLEELLVEEERNIHISGKINLNDLSAEMAFNVLHLSDYQYYQLMAYLSEYGELVSVWELNAVEGFSYEDVRRLSPLVTVENVRSRNGFFKNFFRKSKSSLLYRYGQVLEKPVGYDKSLEKHYLGSPMRMAFKYQFNSQGKFQLAFSGEKDAGEQFFKGAQKYGFDFYSGYVCLKDIGVLKKAVLGDFRLDFGQGLVVGSSLMSRKGGGVGAVRHFAGMVKPVAPLNEGSALRGVAVTVGNYHYTGTVFAGSRNYDGNLLVGEDSTMSFTGSLTNSGYHRTEAEQQKSDNLRSWVLGADFLYRHRVFRIGARTVYTLFNRKVLPSDKPYQQNNFSGKGMLNVGIDYQLIIKKMVLFGELAVSGNGGWAMKQGALFNLSPGASFAVLAHYSDKKYIALQCSSSSKGEWGIYLISQLVLNAKMGLDFYYDYSRFTWLQYRVDAPSKAMQAGVSMNISVNRHSKLALKYQYKMKHRNSSGDAWVKEVVPFHTSKLRLIWDCQPVDLLKLKTEVDYVINHSRPLAYQHDGFLVYQDVGLDWNKIGLGFHVRLALFDTDTYEERLYSYENDLYQSFTVNSHYDRGWRTFLLVSYKYRWFHVWLKFSQTYYVDKKEIGSGLDLIPKNHKTELKVQLMVKW